MNRLPQEIAHVLERVSLKQPFWTYHAMFGGRPYSFLLDSARDAQTLGRFSFIGAEPSLVFRARRQRAAAGAPHEARCELIDGAEAPRVYVADPLTELRALMTDRALDGGAYAARPVPFLAGAVGYLGYEAGCFVEALPDRAADDLDLPDIDLGFYDATLSHCHQTDASYVSVIGRGTTQREAEARAKRKRDALLSLIQAFESDPPPAPAAVRRDSPRGSSPEHVDEAAYAALVDRAKEHILSGDVFELCLTHRMTSPFDRRPWELYRELRSKNPAPFSCFLSLPTCHVVSSSPERFLKLDAHRVAESRPIKGTRPRGEGPADDARLRAALASSRKDQAENNMIVDLVRSDFGRVCKFGTIEVPELRIIEAYATVFQMVSTIRGQLDDDKHAIDLLRACFPGGSMTGAPKIEAMKIIDQLEPVKRGVYAGSIGYLDFAGPLDLNIVIRTIIVKDGKAHYSVGGAIVADSNPADEYQETLDKARALTAAIANVMGAP